MMVRLTLAVLLACASQLATASLPDFATIVEEIARCGEDHCESNRRHGSRVMRWKSWRS